MRVQNKQGMFQVHGPAFNLCLQKSNLASGNKSQKLTIGIHAAKIPGNMESNTKAYGGKQGILESAF